MITHHIQTLFHSDRHFVTHLRHTPTVYFSNQHANCSKPVGSTANRPTFVLSHTQPTSCSSKIHPKASALFQLHANKEVTGLQSPPCADHNLVCTVGQQQTSFGFPAMSALLTDGGLEEVSEFIPDFWSFLYTYSLIGSGHCTVCVAIFKFGGI
jgi:hypothetical protein